VVKELKVKHKDKVVKELQVKPKVVKDKDKVVKVKVVKVNVLKGDSLVWQHKVKLSTPLKISRVWLKIEKLFSFKPDLAGLSGDPNQSLTLWKMKILFNYFQFQIWLIGI